VQRKDIVLAGGRSIAFDIARNPDQGAFFVLAVRKSGSTILNNIVRALAQFNGLHFVDVAGTFFEHNVMVGDWRRSAAINELIAGGNVYGGFRNMPFAFAANLQFRSSKKLLLVRDPRDALVSEYFTNAFSHPIPPPSPEGDEVTRLMARQREQALSLGIDAYMRTRKPNEMNETMLDFADLLDDPNLALLRYEDVILNKTGLIATICAHFGWTAHPDVVENILSWADVVPEQEDPTAFIRKVIPGDHRVKLSAATIAHLDMILEPSMERFGYHRA